MMLRSRKIVREREFTSTNLSDRIPVNLCGVVRLPQSRVNTPDGVPCAFLPLLNQKPGPSPHCGWRGGGGRGRGVHGRGRKGGGLAGEVGEVGTATMPAA